MLLNCSVDVSMSRHTDNRLTVTSPVRVGRRVNERGMGFYTVPSGEYPINQNCQLRSTGGHCVSYTVLVVFILAINVHT